MAAQTYTLPDLPYDPGTLKPHINGHLMELHHDKHHAAYVKGANTTLEKLADLRGSADFSTLAQLERNLAFNVSGHVLHSIFWTNLSPDGGGEPTGPLADELGRSFGGFEGFRRHMTEAATSVQGSGWALAAWEPVAGRLLVQQVHDHQGNHGQGMVPLLAIDAWEHAYYVQYLNEKAEYVDAIWNVVNWPDVQRRFEQARSGELVGATS